MRPIDLITIARAFGAGGGELAESLGARLGWRVLDHDLVERVAGRLGVARDDVAACDEHAPRILERIGSVVLRTSPNFAPAADPPRQPGPDEIADATRDVLRAAAESPPLVVVGHGAQALFHDRPGTLHLRLVAPLRDRVRRICARAGCTGEDAVALARRMDDERIFYVRHYYHRDWHDPLLYDIHVNTDRVSIDEAADMVTRLVHDRGGHTANAALDSGRM